MAVDFTPLNDRILVARPPKRAEITRSGLFIPDVAVKQENEGVVVAIGRGALLKNGQRAAMELQVGDHVLFSKYAEQDIKVHGLDAGEYAMMRETDVLAVLTEGKIPTPADAAEWGKSFESLAIADLST